MTSALQWLELLIGYIVCGLVAVCGLIVLWRLLTGEIDLKLLISEKTADGKPAASMSRFQLLIFTFVIALSFFLIVVSNAKLRQGGGDVASSGIPDVPGGVLALLGISASSYTVSKAIQANMNKKPDDENQ